MDWRAWWEISRPKHIPICAGGTALALYVLGSRDPTEYIVASINGAFLVTAAIIHNDVVDVGVDTIAKPYRPIPSGRISTRAAINAYVGLAFIAIFLNALLNPAAIIAILGICAVTYYYNVWGKQKHAFAGNIAVGIACTAPIYYPMAILGDWSLWPQCVGIILSETCRSVIITCQDVEGDRKAGYKTLPAMIGARKSLWVALMFLAASIPFLYYTPNANLGLFYRIAISLWVICLIISLGSAFTTPNFDVYQFWARRMAKNSLLLLLIALIIDLLI